MTGTIWAVYRCKKLKRGETPKDEVFVSAHKSLSDAAEKKNALAFIDRKHSYTVGPHYDEAPARSEETSAND